jgi:hypothetical protein
MQLLGGLAVITVVVAAVFYLTFPAYKHRYRMTVEIEADGNPHTGSGVVDVSHHYHGPFAGLLAGRYDSSFSGDAPVVDLGKYGIVLAVLSPANFPSSYRPQPRYASDIAILGYFGPPRNGAKAEVDDRIRGICDQVGERVLKPTMYPGFVWLPNRLDPNSARPVMPSELPTIIDPSVRLRSVSIEVTTQRNKGTLFEKLPWLAAMRAYDKQHPIQVDDTYKLRAQYLLGE